MKSFLSCFFLFLIDLDLNPIRINGYLIGRFIDCYNQFGTLKSIGTDLFSSIFFSLSLPPLTLEVSSVPTPAKAEGDQAGWMWKLGGSALNRQFQRRYFAFSAKTQTLFWQTAPEVSLTSLSGKKKMEVIEWIKWGDFYWWFRIQSRTTRKRRTSNSLKRSKRASITGTSASAWERQGKNISWW